MEESIQESEVSSLDSLEKKEHKFQDDLNVAQNAANIGKMLSGLSMLIHLVGMVLVFFISINSYQVSESLLAILPLIFGGLGILFSWAVVHSLLSIVVTNALTAKHSIYHSSKLQSVYNKPL